MRHLPATSDQAVAAGLQAGQDIIVGQILASETAGSAVIAGLLSSPPSVDLPMQDSAKAPVPFPRPRPDWMGLKPGASSLPRRYSKWSLALRAADALPRICGSTCWS